VKYILLILLLLGFSMPAYAQELPRLSVSGNRLQAEGKPITLRGLSLCSLEWHNPLSLIEQSKTWKPNVLRLPVQAKEWKKSNPIKYLQNYLDPAVKACKRNNVYCIIDWHDIAAWDDPKTSIALKSFWDRTAPRYAAEQHILYEIFNEPTSPKARTRENWIAWRTQAQKWVDSIRVKAPQTVLLVGSPHWSQMPSFAAADPLRGSNLAYTMHIYPNYPIKKWDSLFGDASKAVPIFITEWGWTSDEKAWSGIKGSQEKYGEPLKAYLDSKPQINWTAWSFDPKCGPAMLGGDKDMGTFVKDWLAEYN